MPTESKTGTQCEQLSHMGYMKDPGRFTLASPAMVLGTQNISGVTIQTCLNSSCLRRQTKEKRFPCCQIERDPIISRAGPQPAHSRPPLLNLALQASLPFAVSIIRTQFPFLSEH